MILVADASPLIFLAKLKRLDLLTVLDTDIHLSRLVHDELLNVEAAGEERRRLEVFLATCQVHPARDHRPFAAALSRADNATLALALRLKARILLADDRILRTLAETEGLRPLGTLGVLLQALRQGRLTRRQARHDLDALVGLYGFRIGIEVYQTVVARIEELGR
jgi:predicted nucleic acid-binding protein